MTGSAIVSEIFSIMTSGFSSFATGFGAGLQALIQAIFFTTTGTGSDAVTTMSTFGILIIVFATVSITIGLCRGVVYWLQSLGAKRV